MSNNENQWTIDIKEIPHHFAVMIKDIEKASGMHKASARREDLLEKVRSQLDEIIQNGPNSNFKKIDDYLHNDPEKTVVIDSPYARVDVKRYEPPVTKKTTPAKTVKKKTRKRKTNGRKGYSVKCGYCGQEGHNARTCTIKKHDERMVGLTGKTNKKKKK